MKQLLKFLVTFQILILLCFGVQAQTIKSGVIKGKSVSWTTGSVSIVKTSGGHEIRLGRNFKTKSGPSLWVYLGNDGPEKRIGRLKSTTGAQTYRLPGSVDPTKYRKIYIHCVPFNATFGFGMLR